MLILLKQEENFRFDIVYVILYCLNIEIFYILNFKKGKNRINERKKIEKNNHNNTD
jgi:hypothetical protein